MRFHRAGLFGGGPLNGASEEAGTLMLQAISADTNIKTPALQSMLEPIAIRPNKR
jgi:hypothetical protein